MFAARSTTGWSFVFSAIAGALVACSDGGSDQKSADAGANPDAMSNAMPEAGTGDPDAAEAPGTKIAITGEVFDAESGLTLKSATLLAKDEQSATSDGDGHYDLQTRSLAPVAITRAGYAGITRAVPPAGGFLDVFLKSIDKTVEFRGDKGTTVRLASGVGVEIPAGAVVDAKGKKVSGTVKLELAAIDAQKVTQAVALPGDGTASQKDGKHGRVSVDAGLSIRITDSKGEDLTVDKAAKVVAEIPARRKDADPELGVYSFDDDKQDWREESKVKKSTNADKEAVYRADIDHLSWWSIGRFHQSTTCVRACVKDGKGKAVPGAQVWVVGATQSGVSSFFTDDTGCGAGDTIPDTDVVLVAQAGNLVSKAVSLSVAHAKASVGKNPNACQDAGTLTIGVAEGEKCPLCGIDDEVPPVLGEAGEALWGERFCESGNCTPIRIASDADGNAIVVGQVTGTINFAGTGPTGSEALSTTRDNSGFVAKLDADGQHVWSHLWTSDSSGIAPVAAATDQEGNIVVVGQVYGSADVSGSTVMSTGTYAALVVMLDPDGEPIWSKAFDDGPGTYGFAQSVVVDSNGDVIVGGNYGGAIAFPGATLDDIGVLDTAGGRDLFLVKLDGDNGNHLWSFGYGDTADQSTIRLAIDASDALTLAGSNSGTLDFGGGALPAGQIESAYLAHLDSEAGHLWSTSLPTASITAVTTDAANNIVYTGRFSGSVDFSGKNDGSGSLTAVGTGDLFVAKISADGTYAFARGFVAPTGAIAGVGVGPNGAISIGGTLRDGTTSFTAGGVVAPVLACEGERNAFVANFTSAGAHRYSFCAGTTGSFQQVEALAIDSAGHTWVYGDFYDVTTAITFQKAGGGNLTLTRGADTDSFLFKLVP